LTFLPTLHTLEEHRAHFGHVVAGQEVWVWDDGQILGFAAFDDSMLNYLYVEPDAFGHGIGTALYTHAVDRRPDGFTFWVFQENERARRFYERHGACVIRFTGGDGNEERTPDVLYASSPARAGAA
jgi:ribosomal protein S18 acetylase RimI-like enzyme